VLPLLRVRRLGDDDLLEDTESGVPERARFDDVGFFSDRIDDCFFSCWLARYSERERLRVGGGGNKLLRSCKRKGEKHDVSYW
jgi:hypothetical protein